MSDENTTKTETPEQDKPEPTTPSGQAQTEGQEQKGLSQEEVNKIIGNTRKEARERAQRELMESLGVTDIETAKAQLTELAEKKAAELSETEKLQASLDAALKAKQDAEAAVEQIKQQRLADQRQAAFLKAAQAGGAKNADDLLILVMAKSGEGLTGVFDENAQPDTGKMEAFIKQVQADYPTYFGTAGAGSPSNAGGIPPTSKAQAAQEAEAKVRQKFGRM